MNALTFIIITCINQLNHGVWSNKLVLLYLIKNNLKCPKKSDSMNRIIILINTTNICSDFMHICFLKG